MGTHPIFESDFDCLTDMSSAGDPQETTNDGSDSKHRERIAAHYKESAKTKTGLKWYLLGTLLVNAFIAAHVYLKKMGKMYLLTTRATPQPFIWEIALLGTTLPALVGWTSLQRNNVGRMKFYIWGTLLLGLPPLIWGGYLHYDDLMKHINGTGYRRTILGYPRAIVIYGFILCFGEILSCGFTKGRRLIELWTKKNFGSSDDEAKSNKESKKKK